MKTLYFQESYLVQVYIVLSNSIKRSHPQGLGALTFYSFSAINLFQENKINRWCHNNKNKYSKQQQFRKASKNT